MYFLNQFILKCNENTQDFTTNHLREHYEATCGQRCNDIILVLLLCRRCRIFCRWTLPCWHTHTGGFLNSSCWTDKPGSRKYFFLRFWLSTSMTVWAWLCVCVGYHLYGVILCAGVEQTHPLFPVWGTLRVFIKIIVTTKVVMCLFWNTVSFRKTWFVIFCFLKYTKPSHNIDLKQWFETTEVLL